LLKESLNKWLKIDPIEIIREILSDRAILKWIEEKNRKQLKKGLNSEGVKLSDIGGEYSAVTLDLNPDKVADKVDLFDTGKFYESIIAQANLVDFVEITANPIKVEESGQRVNLYNRWGKDIIGLNEENLQELIEIVKDKLIIEILKKV
tara:strand:+ start:3637 stop:4083 length:447 start_codon:yes stop_codon:yes gene_type:complete